MTLRHTAADLARIVAQPGYGIDTSATSGSDALELSANAAKFAPGQEFSDLVATDTTDTLFRETLTRFCEAYGFPPPEFEHRFHHVRRWRFDAAIPSLRVAIELEGGQWVNGRHNRPGAGYEGDIEKYNAAALLGWFVLRFTTDMLRDGRMLATLQGLPPF